MNEIKDETNNALTAVATQSKAIDESLSSLDNVIKELKAADRQKDEEFKSIKADIESLKDLVPKVVHNCIVVCSNFNVIDRLWSEIKIHKMQCYLTFKTK